MVDSTPREDSLTLRRVIATWWPLAASWLLMSLELPAVSAVVARLADPEINLAAYGGVVFPLSLIVEAPIIMLLAASTALSRDMASYTKLHRFMMRSGFVLTLLHLLIALTPLYDVVVRGLLGAPEEIIEPARIGLIIMTPWTWSIAYRRFNQGVLIRFHASRAVSIGTAVRLGSNWGVLAIGYLIGTIPGIVVGTAAVATGVVAEALYIGLRTRPIVRGPLAAAPTVEPALTFGAFLAFYVPLALTSLLNLLIQPIGSAALGRMPLALASLAAWPVMSGISFIFRSPGIAYNEVVVALFDEPGAVRSLRRFAVYLSVVTTVLLLLITVTPLGTFWLSTVSALPPELVELAEPGLWLMLPLPLLIAIQNWYQGAIVASRRTRGVTEAIAIFLVTTAVVLGVGVVWGSIPGLYVGLAAFSLATFTQTAWLWVRSRPVIARAENGEPAPVVQPAEITAAD
ncbi:MAG TPA: hypothetical protein VKY39_03670 [Aggregatilineales bacterium]|nr:hypothetical protein [Aggregatilineales bacterium]